MSEWTSTFHIGNPVVVTCLTHELGPAAKPWDDAATHATKRRTATTKKMTYADTSFLGTSVRCLGRKAF